MTLTSRFSHSHSWNFGYRKVSDKLYMKIHCLVNDIQLESQPTYRKSMLLITGCAGYVMVTAKLPEMAKEYLVLPP
jgi:hypothetical protein